MGNNPYIVSYTEASIEQVRTHPRRKKPITINLPTPMVADLMEACVAERRTIGKMVALMIEEGLVARGFGEKT